MSRLAYFCGLSVPAFKQAFVRRNLLDEWPGHVGKGARFPIAEARGAAKVLRGRTFKAGRTVILLGKRVARAFDVKADYLEPVQVGRASVTVIPHPSGINRWYNDVGREAAVATFMRSCV